MKNRYLEVTFRKGRPLAAYLYLPRGTGAKAVRTEEVRPGLLVDYAESGEPIGLEITAPSQVTLSVLNGVLQQIGVHPVAEFEIAPLKAA